MYQTQIQARKSNLESQGYINVKVKPNYETFQHIWTKETWTPIFIEFKTATYNHLLVKKGEELVYYLCDERSYSLEMLNKHWISRGFSDEFDKFSVDDFDRYQTYLETDMVF